MRVTYPSAGIVTVGDEPGEISSIWSDPHDDSANDYSGGSTIF